jgi:sigma-B regulation protein RsbU (phosphoserine phosphatase)
MADGVGSSTDRRQRLPSVRLLITLIVVVPIVVVAAALIAIATVTSRSIAEELGRELVSSATDRVIFDVKNYLGSAMRVSDLYVRRVTSGALPADNLGDWERNLFEDLAANPDVASICFANPRGDCSWLLHAYSGLELGMVNGHARDRAVEYPAKLDGTVDRQRTIRGFYLYDATARPWYQAALKQPGPVWTPIYRWFQSDRPQDADVMGSGYTRAIYDSDNNLLGILVIDVTLGSLSKFLKELPITKAGYAFVVDEQGLLVAASDGGVSNVKGEQLSPDRSSSAAARAIAPLVMAASRDISPSAAAPPAARIYIEDQPARAQVTAIGRYPGLDWRVVTVLPESYFLAEATSLQRRAILMTLGALAGGAAVGLLLSRRISDPLVRLAAHVARVGAGDFNSRLELAHASELRNLSDEVNRMAGGLQHRMMLEHSLAVAQQVQQALLPAAMPVLKGIELAACSQYCESTGGDYYDFIEMPDLAGHRTLIAVGDVTGHGIGAALLMSTARGAVRSACHGACSLGHILMRANNVLAGSSQQGMFMTLSLLFVDSENHYAHWASAGHDPAIVYHPDSDSFEELMSGDLPLGIEPDVVYREFSRPCATPGTIIVVGTDGIWEARDPDGIMFGKDRLRQVIRQSAASAESVSAGIRKAMYDFVGPSPLKDDVTFVVAKVC